MEFIPGLTARDMPAPATPDEIATRFSAPLFTFAPQPCLAEMGFSTVAIGGELTEVSISYSVFRNPDDPDDPVNFTDAREESDSLVREARDAGQPDWFTDAVRSMRHPTLWEAVCTMRLPQVLGQSIAESLAGHMNHIIVNSMEGRVRATAEGIPELDSDVSPRHARNGATVIVDGIGFDAIHIDTDPDVVGWALDTDGCRVLIAFDRDYAGLVDIALVRRAAAGA
jgi:hypothetical protein